MIHCQKHAVIQFGGLPMILAKLAKDIKSKGNIYVLDEPTTGLHAADVETIMELMDRGDTITAEYLRKSCADAS